MKLKIQTNIKAIIFNADISVANKINFGNGYETVILNLIDPDVIKLFDYTAIGIRRIYESAVIAPNLGVLSLSKCDEKEYEAILKKGKGYFINGISLENFIYNYENNEMNYIDKKFRLLRLCVESHMKINELLVITTVYFDEKPSVFISKIPFDIRIKSNERKTIIKYGYESEEINQFISNTDLNFDNINFDKDLLQKATYLYDQSYYAPTDSLKFMVCLIALESLLVEGNNELTYRLSRNISAFLNDNAKDFLSMILKIKKLYDLRSKFVHNGEVEKIKEEDIIYARMILRNVIKKIIKINKSRKEILNYLELKGFE